MSVGGSFDAYAKSALHERLFGKGAAPQFEFQTIFENQVEPHNRDFALEAGKYIFDCYVLTGEFPRNCWPCSKSQRNRPASSSRSEARSMECRSSASPTADSFTNATSM